MVEYRNNIIMVFGSFNGGVSKIKELLKNMYGVEVEHTLIYNESNPYDGEIRCVHNTLIYVDILIPLKSDLYSVEEISTHIPLNAVGMPQEAVERADLILVSGMDKDDNWVYPYTNRLMSVSQEY